MRYCVFLENNRVHVDAPDEFTALMLAKRHFGLKTLSGLSIFMKSGEDIDGS